MKVNCKIIALGLAGTLLATDHAQAQTETLFRDTFSRSANTDLNAETTGKSGTLGALDWAELNINGIAEVDDNNRLNLDATDSNGNSGAIVYPDHNFTGLNSFEVEIRLLTGSSGGNGRFYGISVGQSKAELDALTSTTPSANDGDFFIGYDVIGTLANGDRGLNIRHNGVNQTTIDAQTLPGFGFPDTLTVKFTYDDMNAGSDLNYEVLMTLITGDPAVSVTAGTTTWSGTDENYIALSSNYTGGSRINYFQVAGEVSTTAAPGDTDGDGDIDDSDLGTSFANYTGPVGAAGNKTAAEGDTDGDGDVDDSDLGTSFSGYTGPQSPAAVPEPTSLALLGLGGLLIARRRRA